MSKGVNKVIVLGNIGTIETKETRGGKITRLSVATSDKWKDKETGQEKESTEWHNAVMFGKLAEIGEKYLEKGMKIYLEGSLKTSKYQADDGSERYSTQIIVKDMQMCGKSNSDVKHNKPPVSVYDNMPIPPNRDDIYDDDVPF